MNTNPIEQENERLKQHCEMLQHRLETMEMNAKINRGRYLDEKERAFFWRTTAFCFVIALIIVTIIAGDLFSKLTMPL